MTEALKHTPTEEQVGVIDAVGGKDSVMVSALAGCSKSTTLQMAAPRVKVPALALAFNKKIATDLAPRLPGNFSTKTFNGLGFAAVLRALPGVRNAQIDDKKLGKLVSQVARERKVELSGDQWDGLRKLVTGAMQVGIVPDDRGRPLNLDTRENWETIADSQWLLREDFEFLYDMAREVLVRNNQLVEQGIMSFDDQVYYSACIAGQFPKFPVVFVDEAQDLSPLNHAMLAQCTREDGRLVVVGDPKQAIYSFRGADSQSMDKMRRLRPNWQDRGLLTTFRCPKSIVERQQHHAPGFKAWHTNPEGRFQEMKQSESDSGGINFADQGWTWGQVRDLMPSPTSGLMVLCRNNGPLLSLAFKLLRQQIGVVMLGRDIGKNLVALSRKLLPEDGTDKLVANGIVAAWIDDESSLARTNGHEEKIAGITDRGECLLAVLSSGCRDAGELRTMLTRLFARDTGQVKLSSIHRAKGLEEDVILHLDPWRIPSRYAREAAKLGDRRQLEQEWNLKYVAETRTKHTLINANLEDFLG